MKVFIDAGLTCGVVCVENGKIIKAVEMPIHCLFIFLYDNTDVIDKVFLEDARLNVVNVSKETGTARAQGAGWIKTLCKAIEVQLQDYKIKYQLIKPSKQWTKKDGAFVALQTGIPTERKQQNLRDALMMYKFYGF